MNSIGIYFGPKGISIAESKGRRLINTIHIPQAIFSSAGLEEKVPAEVKAIEIVALIKGELRKNKIEAGEATLCISGHDLIIRTLELPLIPREELKNAVYFEAKKYIPFRMEDLISDFQVQFDKLSRTNLILFMGIKKETLEEYTYILNQLNMKINAVEYSGFSILRALTLAGIKNKGIISVMVADLAGERELNFTVLENGFPLFSRDIVIGSAVQEPNKTQEGVAEPVLEKIKTEIRFSLDYYRRKFPAKNIQKTFILCDKNYRSQIGSFISEAGLGSQFIDVESFIGKPTPYFLNSLKAYATSLSKSIKSDLKIDLLAAKARMALTEEGKQKLELALLLKDLKVGPGVFLISLLICASAFGFGLYRKDPLRKQLNTIIAMRPQVESISPEISYKELNLINIQYKKKLAVLNNILKKEVSVIEPLNLIPRVLPVGAWLNNFSFKRAKEGTIELVLEGMVYLADTDKEYQAVNEFIAKLKGDPEFTKYFKGISIVSLDSAEFNKLPVARFSILCKASDGRE